MIKKFHANRARLQRHRRMRSRLAGREGRPRLSVFRSGGHIYAQIIDDTTGRTLVAASSLDESLRNFQHVKKESQAVRPKEEAPVQMAASGVSSAPAKGKGAKAEKAPAKGAQPQQKSKGGRPAQTKTVLPSAQKGEKKTPVEALAAIADNRKVAVAREVGKLIAQRAREQGVSHVVFDRGGYAYHGRVAALAEGAREVGLDF
jgi:large subunit ribosomal protein L18